MTPQEIDSMPAGPEMDALIAVGVMRLELSPNVLDSMPPVYFLSDGSVLPEFSSSIADAWQVIEKLGCLELQVDDATECNNWECRIVRHDSDFCYLRGAEAQTAPLAICRAALKTVQTDEKANEREDEGNFPKWEIHIFKPSPSPSNA